MRACRLVSGKRWNGDFVGTAFAAELENVQRSAVAAGLPVMPSSDISSDTLADGFM